MSNARLRLRTPQPAAKDLAPRRPLGRYLVDAGILRPHDLLHALGLQRSWDAPLGEILIAEGLATEGQVLEALAAQTGLHVADLEAEPPGPDLIALLPAQIWLRLRIVPWMRLGDTLIVATAWPDAVDDLLPLLQGQIETILVVIASDTQVMQAISATSGTKLALRAERRVAPRYSSRTWQYRGQGFGLTVAAALGSLILCTLLAPVHVVQVLCLIAILTLIPVAALKLTAFGMYLLGRLDDPPPPSAPSTSPSASPSQLSSQLPRISMLVPLYHETEIASALVSRLRRLHYPKALLDVILVLEEKDTVTRDTLAATDLPHWMRAIAVPDTGPLTTKPRALNYALDFCRGDIVGVWDAEDAPAPDQLDLVAARFAQAGPEVACLQGVLDYYNPRSNWMARCFTIEYAGWWRVLLPGVERLGLILPLGGTTLFFRRTALEALGAWDAHNVTEDADLGVRLGREGYRTELIQTVTHEEANCRPLPWIKQRSRWLKGFMVTWLVHLRQPRLMIQQVGFWRAMGVHTLMAGTVAQFVFAPALWSLWLLAFGLWHPIAEIMGPGVMALIVGLCVLSELGNLAIASAGAARRSHRFLLPIVPTMPLYNALGVAAAFKALYELLIKPYYWDKTQHGVAAPELKSAKAQS